MTNRSILYEVKESIATIVLHRPETANSFSQEMNEEVLAALQTATEDENVRVIVIASEGKIFSAGGDLQAMRQLLEQGCPEKIGEIVAGVAKISQTMKQCPKPIIMQIQGAAAGAAFNLALAADFCITTPKTKFIQAFVKVGLIPDAGGLFLLSRAVGMQRALQLAMTGEPLLAEEGKERGFIYEICEPEALALRTRELALQLAQSPRQSLAGMKSLLWIAQLTEWEHYQKEELAWQTRLSQTADFKEGVMAFIEKRNPKFE